MNEASSKFVDNLALEKLLNEKVTKVSHSPKDSHFAFEENLFEHLGDGLLDMHTVQKKETGNAVWFEIPSFLKSPSTPENNTIYLSMHPAADPDGNILFLHGLFDDNIFNYAYLIRLFNELRLNVFFMIHPYHFQRKPAASLFSGEYFFSADIYRTQHAIKQAIFDVDACLQLIHNLNPLPAILAGFSMGGTISFRYYQLKKQMVKTFLINPVTDLSRVIWDNPLLVPVDQDLQKSGFMPKDCIPIFKELDPCENLEPGVPLHNLAMVFSIYDQIIEMRKNELFIERSGLQNVHTYHAGHLNILRVPKLAMDIRHFFENQNNFIEVKP